MNLTLNFLRNNLYNAVSKHRIVNSPDPQRWVDVVRLYDSVRSIQMKDSRQLSKLITKLCLNQSGKTLDVETLLNSSTVNFNRFSVANMLLYLVRKPLASVLSF
jgi:hypothetical protein